MIGRVPPPLWILKLVSALATRVTAWSWATLCMSSEVETWCGAKETQRSRRHVFFHYRVNVSWAGDA